jgi:hypothetical protein
VGNKPLFMRHLSVSPVPNLRKTTQSPQSDLTHWILTLVNSVQLSIVTKQYTLQKCYFNELVATSITRGHAFSYVTANFRKDISNCRTKTEGLDF